MYNTGVHKNCCKSRAIGILSFTMLDGFELERKSSREIARDREPGILVSGREALVGDLHADTHSVRSGQNISNRPWHRKLQPYSLMGAHGLRQGTLFRTQFLCTYSLIHVYMKLSFCAKLITTNG